MVGIALVLYSIVTAVTLIDSYHMSGSDGMSGFPAESAVTARAAKLHRLVDHPSELSVYPDMTFDCSGNVRAVWMLVRYSGTSVTSMNLTGFQLRLLRPGPLAADGAAGSSLPGTTAGGNCLQYHQLPNGVLRLRTLQPESVSSSGSTRLLHFQLESPVAVMAGDILGIRQGHSVVMLLSQKGRGPQRYTISNDHDGRTCYYPVNNEASQDYPLIAIDFGTTGMSPAFKCT